MTSNIPVMGTTLNVTEAKARFSDVVKRAAQGEEIIVTKMGKPVVKIIRYDPSRTHQRIGLFTGQIDLAEDFDEWPEDVAHALGMID